LPEPEPELEEHPPALNATRRPSKRKTEAIEYEEALAVGTRLLIEGPILAWGIMGNTRESGVPGRDSEFHREWRGTNRPLPAGVQHLPVGGLDRVAPRGGGDAGTHAADASVHQQGLVGRRVA